MGHSGGCQCGAVRFRITGTLGQASICHCRMCQKAFGNFYAPLVSVPEGGCVWTKREPARFRSSNHVVRGFCDICGTPLTYEAPDGMALAIGALLGPWGFGATVFGVIAAWAYSAEPVRLKRSGIWGPGLVGLCYEGLPWFTGAAVLAAGAPSWPVVIVAALYALGAHGIMTLNDFKALEGDRQTGVNSLPVTLGPERAARVACWVMALPQLGVIALLLGWDRPWHAAAIGALLIGQFWAMRVLLSDPKGRAPWYNGTGVLFYVSGMMVAAFALRGIGGIG